MMVGQSKRKGNVMLPFQGLVLGFFLFLPCWLFLTGLFQYYYPAGVQLPALPFPVLVFGVCMSGMFCLMLFMVSIGIPICLGSLEAVSEHVGLGASQFWTGATRREKICRELARLSLLVAAGGLAIPAALCLPESYPVPLRLFGWGAFCDLLVITLFAAVVLPLKRRWPHLGGFAGDPNARYHHSF